MKHTIIAVVALVTTPVIAETFDFADPRAQCTDDLVTPDATETFANTPIGKLGYHIVYLKDLKEVSRSKDKLSCSATIVFNTRLPGASSDAVPFKIELLNRDGHVLIEIQRDDELARAVRASKARDDAIAEAVKKAEKKPTPPKPKAEYASAPAARPTAARTEVPAERPAPSKRIVALQRALAEYGYGQIKPSGIIDADTQSAIERFERERKLPITGQASDRVVRELAAMAGRPLE